MRYRVPILQRTPFITRHSVFNRTPIITRVPVLCDRNSFAVEYEDSIRCRLCNSCKDCSGCEYYAIEDNLSEVEDYRKFVVLRADEFTEDELIKEIFLIETSGKYIRMLTSKPMSQEVIKSFAYSPYNVIQFNLDLTKPDSLSDSIYFASKCGLLISLYLSPVIPTVIKASQVLSIIDHHTSVVDYFCIRFFKKPIELECEQLGEFVTINNTLVPSKFLEIKEEHLICSKDYTNKFLDIVNTYAKPRKINIVLCDNNSCY
jgi:hypothetical protein